MIFWNNVDLINVSGKLMKKARTVMLPLDSGDLLLRQILAMPHKNKKPISLTQANEIAYRHLKDCVMKHVPGFDCKTFRNNHIHWLSEQGYCIELDGSEYHFTKELPLQ